MALELIDGTSGAVDISIDGHSAKCYTNYWSADFQKELFEQTTFCSTNWRTRKAGVKGWSGRATGFLPYNAANTDPTAAFDSDDPVPLVLTAFTGCTISGDAHISNVHVGVGAAGNSELSFNFDGDGVPVIVWDEA